MSTTADIDKEAEEESIKLLKAFVHGYVSGSGKLLTDAITGEKSPFRIEGNVLYYRQHGWKVLMARLLSNKVALVRSSNTSSYGTIMAKEAVNQVIQELEGAGYYCIRIAEEDYVKDRFMDELLIWISDLRKEYNHLENRTIDDKTAEAMLGGFVSLGRTDQHIGELHRAIIALTEYRTQIRTDGELKIIKELQEIAPGGYHYPFADKQVVVHRVKAAREYLALVNNYIDVLQEIAKAHDTA